MVSINAEGDYFINLGEVDTENPEPVALASIGESVSRIRQQNPGVPVYLEADEAVPYGRVMTLMSRLEKSGVDGVRLITEPPE